MVAGLFYTSRYPENWRLEMTTATAPAEPLLLSVKDAAAMLGMSAPSIWTKLKNGGFPRPRHQTGNFTRWHRDDIEAFARGEWEAEQ